jgi:uncharacterized protein YhfF
MKQFEGSDPVLHFWLDVKRDRAIVADGFHATTLSDPAISTAVNRLAGLVAGGRKVATSHLVLDFENNGVPARAVGDHWVIVDAEGQPCCVVKVTRIETRPFFAVDEETARAEAGGDLSLDYWRDVHRTYFRKQCEQWNVAWSEDLPVVTEFLELK